MDDFLLWMMFIALIALIIRYNKDHPQKLTKKQKEIQKKTTEVALWILGIFVAVIVLLFIWALSQ